MARLAHPRSAAIVWFAPLLLASACAVRRETVVPVIDVASVSLNGEAVGKML